MHRYDNTDFPTMILIWVIVVIVVLVRSYFRYRNSLNTDDKIIIKRKMSNIAEDNGYGFIELIRKDLISPCEFKYIKNLGEVVSYEYNITGSLPVNDKEAVFHMGLCVYQNVYTSRDRHSYKETKEFVQRAIGYYIIKCESIRLPYFFMRRENKLSDSLYKLAGMQDINFEDGDEFSSSFILQGDHANEVRKLFKNEIRSRFIKLADKDYVIEGYRDKIIVYGDLLEQRCLNELNSVMSSIIRKIVSK